MINAEEKVKRIYEILADFLGAPCNFNNEYMFDRAATWCEKNCGKVLDAACWEKFLDVKMEEAN
jgi:hypothetical protein